MQEYVTNPKAVEDAIEALLIKSEKSELVSNGKLTQAGEYKLESLMTGPISIQSPPIKLAVVQNQYDYTMSDKAPKGMPKASKSLNSIVVPKSSTVSTGSVAKGSSVSTKPASGIPVLYMGI